MSLDTLIITLGQLLKNRHWQLTTAESCTGGGLAYYLTNVAGSSDWFERGFVTYSNLAKQEMLGVTPETLQIHGAVSELTAKEMVTGALQASHAQLAMAITGIAGPSGGTPTKPVGTVWLAWGSINGDIHTHVNIFSGDRVNIRQQTIQHALEILIRYVSNLT